MATELSISDIKLYQAMTWWQSHFIQISWIPGTHDNTSIIGFIFDFVNNIHQLIHTLSSIVGFCISILSTKMTPLKTIDRTKIAFFSLSEPKIIKKGSGTICIPNSHVFVLQLFGICRTKNKPEQFFCNASPKDLFGS